jgi:beta-lactamase class D
MKKAIFLILLNLFSLNAMLLAEKKIIIDKSLDKYFEQKKVFGTFILTSLDKSIKIANNELYNTQYTPASTFKIPNTIIALESEVIKDENEIIKWDGVERWLKSWNQDTDLKMAMQNSTVWFYQELARRVGKEKMQSYLKKIEYGNKNINGGIDKFWLSGDLKISPKEQIDFLRKVYLNNFKGISKRSIDITKAIMLRDSTNEYKIRAKTGWFGSGDYVGWYVGWVETKDNTYFFATCIEPFIDSKTQKYIISDDEFTKARIDITYDILREFKIIK